MKFAAPCFSGGCGLCAECDNHDDISDKPEHLRRADDLSKLIGSKLINKITDDYNSNLKKWCNKYDYRCSEDIGWAPTIISKYKKINNEPVRLKLIQETHSSICDDPWCKVMFVNSSERLHTSFYPSIPIYTRVLDGKLKLCGPCLARKPTPPEIIKIN